MSTESPKTTRLFVSHISEEADVAALLKKMMEEDFQGRVTFFTSSDIGSIDLGENWLAAVGHAIGGAAAVIVLCSKASVHRPWVQFEIGAAWMKSIPIVPVCHSGMSVAELKMPLVLWEGIDLGTERGLERLYQNVARRLSLESTPRPSNMSQRLQQIRELEQRFRNSFQQFERYINIVIPEPGRLEAESIPDSAAVQSDEDSLELFGLMAGADWTWSDIVRAARKRADTRWLAQLQRCVFLASRNEVFNPVQAIYHTDRGSYQPQLSKKEPLPNGDSSFHVHFVDTVVAPLTEVGNEFGLMATMLRLGLRFRYEVIERFRRLERAGRGSAAARQAAAMVQQLRGAVEIIENDALSRGAENIERDAVVALFERPEDQDEIGQLMDEWDVARALLFCDEPPLAGQEEVRDVVRNMRRINLRFMVLGTRRFHEMVEAAWDDADGNDQLAPTAAARTSRPGPAG